MKAKKRPVYRMLLAGLVILTACQPAPVQEFAIYLLSQPFSAAQADALGMAHVPLQAQAVIASADVLSYSPETYALTLTPAAGERLMELKIPVHGLPFVVCVGSQRIYSGAFWASYSSLSYDGVIIELLRGLTPQTHIRIELGYPGINFFRGHDPRADSRVLQALRAAGKIH